MIIGEHHESTRDDNKSLESTYGNDYLQWKFWGCSNFGGITKTESAYFSAEIKRTKYCFSKNSKVLDIGFGNGSFLSYALKKNWDISGIEINEELVKTANESGFNVIHADKFSALNSNTFDLVVAFDVLEHLPQDEITDMIMGVKRILKKGGFFIARFPNGDSPFGLYNQNGDVTHITTIGSGKIRYFATKTNMDVAFLGGQAQPLLGVSPLNFIHRLGAVPLKIIIDLLINLFFFPRSNIEFCSSNLTMIYRKK